MTNFKRCFAFFTLLTGSLITLPSLFAQGGGGGGGGDDGPTFSQPVAGIDVDAAGVLKVRQFDPRLAKQRLAAARTKVGDTDVMQSADLRKVSLNRLEAAIAARLAKGEGIDEEMQALAGLTSIEYVFFYPETNDIVVAGPAEGFFADPTDRLIGMETGRPVVLLEDLVTALRAYRPGYRGVSVISVSIDPTAEGLQRMNKFLASVRGRVSPSDARRLASGLKQNLGLQTVTIRGIPTSTHFARVLVEADYRMKLIGIGKYDFAGSSKIPSIFDLMTAEEELKQSYREDGSLSDDIGVALSFLDQRERKVLSMRFGMEKGESMKLDDIADSMNVSGERVRQLESLGLRKLRAVLLNNGKLDFRKLDQKKIRNERKKDKKKLKSLIVCVKISKMYRRS